MLNLPASTSQDEYIPLAGGLDQLTPTLSLKPGVVRDGRNFECAITGGYTRIAGYERHDGRANPSDATYLTATMTVTGSLAAGDAFTGGTSGATGTVIYVNGDVVAYTKSTGSIEVGEDIEVGGVPQASVTALGGADTGDDFDVRMRALAADEYRADIGAVPGSGPIRGVVYFNGITYAWRDNAGGTALDLYKTSAGGWVQVAMLYSVAFTLGTAEYVDGDTLTQGADSATIKRVCLQSGSWGAGDAAGRFIITAPAPSGFAAGAATGTGACTLSGAEAQIALLPGGRVETDIGTVDSARRVYGVDGVNPAFEFDGETLALIATGNAVDVPSRVMVHSGHLFLAFDNSVQNSGIGAPFNWTVIAGAGERQADGEVTVMQRLPGSQATGAAAICHEAGIQMLYGTSGADFQLVSFEDSSGAKAYSGQRLGQMFVLDDRGVLAVSTSQNFGNFAGNTLTLNIRPFLAARRNSVTASLVNREKNQYRLFFADGSGLYMTIANGKLLGSLPVQFAHPVRCACVGETPEGQEAAFFGSDDGWVFRLDAGTSFDGEAIDYDLTLVYANQRSPRQNKRYRKLTFEVQGESYATFDVQYDLAYASSMRAQPDIASQAAIALAGAYWDEFTWDAFTWDGSNLAPVEIALEGSGENIAVRISGSSALFDPFSLNSMILTYSPRGRKR